MARAEQEMQAYISGSTAADKKKNHRDAYTKKLQEQETQSKALRDQQKALKEQQETSGPKQIDMWRDLVKIMQFKQASYASGSSNA
jgi:hypothetical protein